jgi:hypothetical protein
MTAQEDMPNQKSRRVSSSQPNVKPISFEFIISRAATAETA